MPPDEPPERLTYTVEEAAILLGISRAFAYEAVHQGDIPHLRVRRRILIPRSAVRRLVEGDRYVPPAIDNPHPERLVYSVEEAAVLLGISRSFAYEAIQHREIPHMRIGKTRVVVPKSALHRMVEDAA